MRSGYPRFFVHPLVISLADSVNEAAALNEDGTFKRTQALLFSSARAAKNCHLWITGQAPKGDVGSYSLSPTQCEDLERWERWSSLHVVWCEPELWPLAKAF
jgi:hypothetical protein